MKESNIGESLIQTLNSRVNIKEYTSKKRILDFMESIIASGMIHCEIGEEEITTCCKNAFECVKNYNEISG